MSEREERFSVGERPKLEVQLPSGDLRVASGPDGVIELRIDGGDPSKYRLEQIGDKVVFAAERGGFLSRASYDLAATVPRGTVIDVKLGSADFEVDGAVEAVRGSLASGDVRIDEVAANTELKIASGDIEIDTAHARLDVSSASGDIRVRRVDGDVKVSSASGDLRIGSAGGRVDMKTASGDVTVGSFEGRVLAAKSLSGDVTVGIPQGRTVYLDVLTTSGDVRNAFGFVEGAESTGRAEIKVKTVSGDVVLRSAR